MPTATIGSLQLPNNEDCGIRDVWAHNLEDEFRTIRKVSGKLANCDYASLCDIIIAKITDIHT